MLDNLNFLQFFLGVFGGTGSAIVTLFIFHYLLSGRVYFSERLRSVRGVSVERQSYSVKTMKTGFVDLIEIRTVCRLIIKDIYQSGSGVWYHFDIPCSFSNSLVYKTDTRIIQLKFHESKLANLGGTFPRMASFVSQGNPELGYRVEDFFMAYQDIFMKVYITGHDRFTGTKKLFESKKYYFHDIREGSWEKDSLKLKLD